MQKKSKIIIISIAAALVLVVGVFTAISLIGSSEAPVVQAGTSEQLSLGQKFLIDLEYEKAVAEFNAVIEIEPKNVDAYIGLADAYIGMGDENKAIEALEKGLAETGDERIRAKLDEVKKAEETTTATVTTSETTEASPTVIIKEDIELAITSDKKATITLKNLDIKDSYVVNKETSIMNELEYSWGVRMLGNPKVLEASITSWANPPGSPGLNKEKTIEEMQSDLWDCYEGGAGLVENAVTSTTCFSDKIIWDVVVPDEYDFSFYNVTEFEIRIYDGTGNWEERAVVLNDETTVETTTAPETTAALEKPEIRYFDDCCYAKYQYDSDGRVVYEEFYNKIEDNIPYLCCKILYDSDGNFIGETIATPPRGGYSLREYDSQNKLIKSTEYEWSNGEDIIEAYSNYEYNSNGKLVKEIYYSLNYETQEFELSTIYEYDSNGKLVKEIYYSLNYETQEFELSTIYYEYDSTEKLIKRTTYSTDGTYKVTEESETTYYNADGTVDWVFSRGLKDEKNGRLSTYEKHCHHHKPGAQYD